MSEPSSAMTFYNLLLAVAREAGMSYVGSTGRERAMIPIDAHDLDVCKDVVNKGIKMFIADAPQRGWRWMRRIMAVTLTATKLTGTVGSASATTIVDATLATTSGTADDASATTIVDATLSATYDADDDLNGKYCYILTGTGANSYALITDYTASTGTITVADWLTSRGLPGGTDPVATDTFAISDYKVQIGDYCYITAGTGKGSYAVITAFTGATGTITVADWLTEQGNPAGTDPDAGSTYALTPIETVGGDITRYPLAEGFGGEVDGLIAYAAGTNLGDWIAWCDESQIRARQAVSVSTGYPRYAAIRPLEPYGSFGPKRRFEFVVDVKPSAAYVLEFPYTLYFDELRLEAGTASSVTSGEGYTGLLDSGLDGLYPDDYFNGWVIHIISGTGKNSYALVDDYTGATAQFDVVDWLFTNGKVGGTDPAASSVYYLEPAANLHPAGFRFDQAILSACLAKGEMTIEEMTAGWVSMYKQTDLPQAHQIDARSAPRKLGGHVYYERYRKNVTTDHDI